MDLLLLIKLVGGLLAAFYVYNALHAQRDALRNALRRVVLAALLGFLTYTVCINRRATPGQTAAFTTLAAILVIVTMPRRTRRIPKSVRRAVIARDLKGEAFDPNKHHIDHIWPWSKGGGHTTDNLRVVSKKANLRKGARRPKLKDWL